MVVGVAESEDADTVAVVCGALALGFGVIWQADSMAVTKKSPSVRAGTKADGEDITLSMVNTGVSIGRTKVSNQGLGRVIN